MGNAHGAMGDFQKQLDMNRKYLEIAHQTGKCQPIILQNFVSQAASLGVTGDRVGEGTANFNIANAQQDDQQCALEHMQRAHEIFKECLGDDHPHTGMASQRVAALQRGLSAACVGPPTNWLKVG